MDHNNPPQHTPIEARVELRKLPPHHLPPIGEALRPPGLPDDEEVPHLEDGEDHELEEGRRRERVEERLDDDARRQVHKAHVRVDDGLLPDGDERHLDGRVARVRAVDLPH
eukprot:CAMPEP_0206217914 /NCGR_PEP_ID=MMETSP0047_2-20121206/3521_1 /ASSEMBLY_ACC=CAM_ASM_000192 /TAXON_ID=195065 /ORGANISM="Chroomonas mesostigmatica_cf, Strain CCMP1168" /LENGTH=110 /DNA_ID=CAMNT_0053640385 /DNA_START=559 /DNA_END=891 /DNA_ORIENTATION=-